MSFFSQVACERLQPRFVETEKLAKWNNNEIVVHSSGGHCNSSVMRMMDISTESTGIKSRLVIVRLLLATTVIPVCL